MPTAWGLWPSWCDACLSCATRTPAASTGRNPAAFGFLDPLCKVTMLAVNSKHDTWQARGVLGLNAADCPGKIHPGGEITHCTTANANATEQGKQWSIYGDMFATAMPLVAGKHNCFLTNCPQHCMMGSAENQPSTPNMTLHGAVQEWNPLAVKRGPKSGFKAPRHIASHTDGCYEVPKVSRSS